MAALMKEAKEGGAWHIVSLYELRIFTCSKSYGLQATSRQSREAVIRWDECLSAMSQHMTSERT